MGVPWLKKRAPSGGTNVCRRPRRFLTGPAKIFAAHRDHRARSLDIGVPVVLPARSRGARRRPYDPPMPTPFTDPGAVLSFWFVETAPRQWWTQSPEFDHVVAARFGALHRAASQCELAGWRATPEGRLAEVIVLDQFPRNMFRDDGRAFATDPLALALAQSAVQAGADRALEPQRRVFLYMPYMHSESRIVHETALALFEALGTADNLDYERRHKAIIDRFGRYPHRNAMLGRASTGEEIAFLKTPGSAF
jgi:uncharacterized protein (DUF924 family)